VPDLLDRMINPRCVDASGAVVGKSSNGTCASGKLEAPAIQDIHVGIVDSSLGGRGSDQCNATTPNPVNPALNGHNDDRGHLLTRGGADEHQVTDAAAGFLAFAPGGDSTKLLADFQDEVLGVNQYGCGFEAQLESWYRFLVQPDPFAALTAPNASGAVTLQGVDATILQQRHDFLRPDSLLNIIVLTDENDSTVDPLSVGGQGWAFENTTFPGSTTGGGAPKGTSICATNPLDPSCTSCAFCQNGSPAAICNDPSCSDANKGYYTNVEDELNVRFFHPKQRFGVDPTFPLSRYVTGLTAAQVPDRNGEHPADANGKPSANYVGAADCTNPIFAKSLPTDPNSDLCHLAAGPRTPDMVLFSIVGGVPLDLLHYDPNAKTAARLSDADWIAVLGKDPLNYDFTGADPRMLESIAKRNGVPTDRTIATNADLQYACMFDLPAPRDCTLEVNRYSCSCDTTTTADNPICDPNVKTTQIKGKAYPTIKELALARALGDQGTVGSICALHTTEQGAGDPLFGYRPAMKQIADRMVARIAE
jgi:hypothetical protein